MIVVDIGELEREGSRLCDYLKSKLLANMTVRGRVLTIDQRVGCPSSRKVKMLVKRFLHHRDLSETYRVIKEEEVIRIKRRRPKRASKARKRGITPSPYETLPYYYPRREC